VAAHHIGIDHVELNCLGAATDACKCDDARRYRLIRVQGLNPMRRALSFFLKAAVSLLLLYLALNWANIGMMSDRLSRIKLSWIGVEVVCIVVQQFLAAMRWRMIVLACGTPMPLKQAFRYIMIGGFFNQTLPSSVGGDAVRIWLLGRNSGWRNAAYSVLLDRLIGVMALAAIVLICLPWTLTLVRNPVGRIALLAIGIGSLLAGLAFLGFGSRRLTILQRWAPTRHLADIAAIGLRLARSPRLAVPVCSLSLVIQLLTVLAAWCAAKSVAAAFGFADALFLMPPVVLISIVPISIAGWGVREGAMVIACGYAGLAQSEGLLVSLLFGAGFVLVGMIGGAVWIVSSDHVPLDRIARPDDLAVQPSVVPVTSDDRRDTRR
jgi:glycosyltransferase 2 family protein